MRICLAAGLALAMATGTAAAETPIKLLMAGFWGTAEDDDVQGAAQAPDGTVIIVGNVGAAATDLPGGVVPTVLGNRVAQPKCGRGFVAHFSADLGRLLHYAELADGIAILTSVQAGAGGVYVSGYAADGLEPLLAGKPGLMTTYPLAAEARLMREGKMLEANGLTDTDPIAGRPGLGRYGAPFVLCLTPDLKTVTAGTYLEGWQQVWDKYRSKTIRPRATFRPDTFWQPTALGLLGSGDLVVCHDGGYFRMLTDKDREVAGDNADLLGRLAFYDGADWVSRLSPDLSKRAWRQPIHTPAVDAETVRRIKGGWPLAHYGSPRTHRMRLDRQENIYLCGWSASYTAKEPWWSPYVWRLSPADGALDWKAYEYDPMSGPDNRMNGQVADTAVATLALDGDGNLLASLFADGGNTVIAWSPKAELGRRFEGPVKGSAPVIKLVHWWGTIHRVNTRTREGLGGARLAANNQGVAGPAWAVDLASLPGNQVLAVGRCNFEFPWTQDAWHRGDPQENPTGFVRVYSAAFDLLFSTALPGVIPFEIVPLSDDRYLIVGQARNPAAPVAGALAGKPRGKADGFLYLVRAAPKAAGR
ncbi:MAG TPA: hypothetical protein VM431_00480 [Phycisphaerae bacterium]|nr:hypothetical protein [Phycisphaerae bacterium]